MRTVQFLGAAGTVTGSMHLVSVGGRRVLLAAALRERLGWTAQIAQDGQTVSLEP